MKHDFPLRVVIDTSVWVAACFRSRSSKLLKLWHEEKLLVCYSNPVLREYQTIFHKIPPIREEAAQILQRIKHSTATRYLPNPPSIEVQIEDPEDLKFIACAAGSQAPFLISLDDHLLKIRNYDKVEIVRPTEFLQRIRQRYE